MIGAVVRSLWRRLSGLVKFRCESRRSAADPAARV